MAETYAVQSRLEVVDELAGALARNAERARDLGEAIRRATGVGTDAFARLAAQGKEAFTGIADVSARLDRSISDLAGEAAIAAGKFRAAGGTMATGLDAPIKAVARLQTAIDKVSATPIRIRTTGDLSALDRAAGGSRRSPDISIPAIPGGGQSWYSVHDAARAANTAGAAGGMGGGPGGAGGPGGTAGPRHAGGHGGFDPLMGGMIIGGVGLGLADALKAPIEQAANLQNARLALQRQLGSSPTASVDYQTATSAAQATSQALPSTTLAANLKAVGDLYSVTGSMKEAAAVLRPVTQYSIAASAINPGKTPDAYTALRSAEMLGWTVDPKSGQMSPQRAQSFLDIMEAAQISTQGRVNEQSILGFAQQAGLAGKNLTAAGLRDLVPIINEMGGQRAGTALSSMSNQLLGGVMPQRVVADWEKLHLINMKDVTATRTGVRVSAGAITNSAAFGADPVAWVERTLLPAMEKAGFSRQAQVTEIMRLFSRTTSQREAGIMATQLVQIQKDYGQQVQAMPTAATVKQLYGQSYDQNLLNMQGAYNTLMQQLGTTSLPTLVPLMQELTKGIQALTSDVAAHPMVARDLLLLGGGIAALAIPIGGTLTAIGALRLALLGLNGLGGAGAGGMAASGAAAAFGTEAGTTLAARLALAAGPVGVAIAAGFLAKFAFGKLDDIITSSAPPNVGRVRDGYHAATGAPAPGSSTGTFLGNLWHQMVSGSGGKTINGKPVSTGGVLSLPAPKAAPATTPAVTSTALNARGQSADHHALVAAVAQGVTQGMDGATVHMDGSKVGAIVLNKINTAMRQPRKSISSRDNRQNPSMPSQAVGNR